MARNDRALRLRGRGPRDLRIHDGGVFNANGPLRTLSQLSTMLSFATLVSARAMARAAPRYTAAFAVASSRHFTMSTRRLGVVKVPEMAESISEGTLREWHKKVGDLSLIHI